MLLRIHAQVKKSENATVVLALDDGQEIRVALPESTSVEEGQSCTITIQDQAEAERSTSELARTILNSILTDEQNKANQDQAE